MLVIGAIGMIGNTVFRVLIEKSGWDTFGSIRDEGVKRFFPAYEKLIPGVDLKCQDLLATILGELQPHVVVNCAGLTKHLPEADAPVAAISINSSMSHAPMLRWWCEGNPPLLQGS